MYTFIWMNATHKGEVVAAIRTKSKLLKIDSVVDSGRIWQERISVGIAYRYKIGVSILPVNKAKLFERKPVNGGQYRRGNETRIGKRHEIVIVVKEIKVSGALHCMADVQELPYLGIKGLV